MPRHFHISHCKFHVPGIPFYPIQSTSKILKTKSGSKSSPCENPQPSTSGIQRGAKKTSKEEASDPTTFTATLNKLRKEGKLLSRENSNASSSSSTTTTSSGSPKKSDAPRLVEKIHLGSRLKKLLIKSFSSSSSRLPFDVDLMNWGEKVAPQKVLVDSEKLRFWGSSSTRDDEELIVPGSDKTVRNIEFTGKKGRKNN